MDYHLKCKICGATCTVGGEDDPDTNGCEYHLDDANWQGGKEDCPHDDYECTGCDPVDLYEDRGGSD